VRDRFRARLDFLVAASIEAAARGEAKIQIDHGAPWSSELGEGEAVATGGSTLYVDPKLFIETRLFLEQTL
jgi:hypothetical protein